MIRIEDFKKIDPNIYIYIYVEFYHAKKLGNL